MSFTAGGKANITGIYLNHGADSMAGFMAGVIDDGSNDNVDGWHQSFYLYPKLQINDNTSVEGEMRFIDRQVLGASLGPIPAHYSSPYSQYWTTNNVYRLWANYKSPIGTFSFGRMPAGTWGNNAFLDSTTRADRITFSTDMGATNLYAIYQKNLETDAYTGDTDEGDQATYVAGVKFGSDMGTTDISVWYNVADQDAGDWTNTEIWYSGAYSFGAIGLATEIHYAMGDDPSNTSNDISSFAGMVNLNTKIDTTTVGFLGFWAQGDEDSTDGDNNGYVTRAGLGNDFNPFVIATGDYFGLYNGDKNSYLSALGISGITGDGDNPGCIATALYAAVPVNDQMTVSAAVGHIWADQSDILGMDLDNKVGWEIDLNMSYKLADNVTYAASVAYLQAGQMLKDAADLGGADTSNILAVVHSLTLTW